VNPRRSTERRREAAGRGGRGGRQRPLKVADGAVAVASGRQDGFNVDARMVNGAAQPPEGRIFDVRGVRSPNHRHDRGHEPQARQYGGKAAAPGAGSHGPSLAEALQATSSMGRLHPRHIGVTSG
jgi:hypothetical protein